MIDAKEIETRFTYHPPKDESQIQRYQEIRARGMELANYLAVNCPASRELSLALTKLEEMIMFANASIARRE